MSENFDFVCATCGEAHEGSASLSFRAPDLYFSVPEVERLERTQLDDDFCTVDGEHFFIRTCLEIPIHDLEEPFLWGVWSSLSQANFERYRASFDAPDQDGKYFSWLSSRLPWYPDTRSLKTWVHVLPGGARPLVELERTDHPLSVDFFHGISIQRAREIYEAALHPR